jgi:hypothetical protein
LDAGSGGGGCVWDSVFHVSISNDVEGRV